MKSSEGVSLIYKFEGTINSASSFNDSYPESSLDAVFGVTPVSYEFEIDFERSVSTFTNSAATWNHFHSKLLGDGYMQQEIGSISGESFIGYNAVFNSGNHLGQISGGNTVRISKSRSFDSDDWRVQDWQVGEEFSFVDGVAAPLSGNPGSAVYYYGAVTLASIVPEPSLTALFGIGVLFFVVRRRTTRLF